LATLPRNDKLEPESLLIRDMLAYRELRQRGAHLFAC
jgi:hypothetical protein